PFPFHVLSLGTNDAEVEALADKVYEKLSSFTAKDGNVYPIERVLYDDRKVQTGEKRTDADLIGIPYQILVGKNALKESKLEVIERKTGKTTLLSLDEFFASEDALQFVYDAVYG
ncbi:MAG: hypothetical protein KBD05_02735, partial [Candidatus Pacebacteria bacterium]|nr:hypothetical protein [Candidatus Paceibacterota bacterium]